MPGCQVERVSEEIKCRTRVVGIFPNGAAIKRLVGEVTWLTLRAYCANGWEPSPASLSWAHWPMRHCAEGLNRRNRFSGAANCIAPAIRICHGILEDGPQLAVFDPKMSLEQIAENPLAAVQGADALVGV